MKKISNYLLLSASLLAVIFNIILFIESFKIKNDGFGTDISFNNDYIASLIIFITLSIYSVLRVLDNAKTKTGYITLLVISAITTFYPLGVFFKAIIYGGAFLDNQVMFYLGIASLLVFLFAIFSYILEIKKEK